MLFILEKTDEPDEYLIHHFDMKKRMYANSTEGTGATWSTQPIINDQKFKIAHDLTSFYPS